MDKKPQDGEDVTKKSIEEFKAGSVIKKQLQPLLQKAVQIADREKLESQKPEAIKEGHIPSIGKTEKTVQEPPTKFSERRKSGFEPDASQELPFVIRPHLKKPPEERVIIISDDSDDERASPTIPIGNAGGSDRQPVEVEMSKAPTDGNNYYTCIENAVSPPILPGPTTSFLRNAGSGWRGMGGNRRGRAGTWTSSFNASRDQTVPQPPPPQDQRNDKHHDEYYAGSRKMRGRKY